MQGSGFRVSGSWSRVSGFGGVHAVNDAWELSRARRQRTPNLFKGSRFMVNVSNITVNVLRMTVNLLHVTVNVLRITVNVLCITVDVLRLHPRPC